MKSLRAKKKRGRKVNGVRIECTFCHHVRPGRTMTRRAWKRLKSTGPLFCNLLCAESHKATKLLEKTK